VAKILLHDDHLNSLRKPKAYLHIHILCDAFDWKVSGLAQICEQFFSNVEECSMWWVGPLQVEAEMDHTQWLELFHPLTSVQSLAISFGLDWLIALALRELWVDQAMEVLPALRTLSVSQVDLFGTFITARRLSNHPVTLIRK
jgi:hypothetical protein